MGEDNWRRILAEGLNNPECPVVPQALKAARYCRDQCLSELTSSRPVDGIKLFIGACFLSRYALELAQTEGGEGLLGTMGEIDDACHWELELARKYLGKNSLKAAWTSMGDKLEELGFPPPSGPEFPLE